MNPWIEALRLRTLPLSVAGVLVAAGIAGRFGVFSWTLFVPMILMVLALQTIANFADEYGDLEKGVDNENRLGPVRGMQRGDITKLQMKRALVAVSLLALAFIIWLLLAAFWKSGDLRGFLVFLALGLLCILVAIKYTVGKGAFGYIGLGDLVTFITFGLLAVAGGFYLYAHALLGVVFLPAVGIGCFAVGVLNLNNMRDYENDKACNKRTLAVLLGPKGARIYHGLLICLGVACFVAFPLVSGVVHPLRYAYLVFCALLLAELVRTLQVEQAAAYDQHMKPLSMTTAFLALAFCVCMAL